MKVLKPLFSIEVNRSNIVERYFVVILVAVEFEHVESSFETGLSFNQIFTVTDCNQTVLKTGRKQKSLSYGEVPCTSRIVPAVMWQLFSNLMRNLWISITASDVHMDVIENIPVDAEYGYLKFKLARLSWLTICWLFLYTMILANLCMNLCLIYCMQFFRIGTVV